MTAPGDAEAIQGTNGRRAGGDRGAGKARGSPVLVPQLHQVLVQLQAGEKEQDFASAPIQVSISVQLWRLPGCHEFLAALGRTGHPSPTSSLLFFKTLFLPVSIGEGW